MSRFISPFETGYRPVSGWRWYLNFLLAHPEAVAYVQHDCFAVLIADGLVCA